jgi:hypothetical protein
MFLGAKSALTLAATRMMELCGQRLTEKEERFMRLEKAINPLLDDNDQVILVNTCFLKKIALLNFTGGIYLHFGQRRQQQAQSYVRVVAFPEAS